MHGGTNGAGVARSLADDNALLSVNLQQVYDWFDTYTIEGVRTGHENRSTSSANLGLTQLHSSTTVAHVDYGGTLQLGQLGNSARRGPCLLITLMAVRRVSGPSGDRPESGQQRW